ncbi:MAG: MSMEG_4193 family putative phosphomutase [Anaerolineae bacterium]|nr:MSMEG_4193 family putative phosphomutase [Anaerolineae bacterium]
MMNLLLIRHAANDWIGKRLAGWTPGVHLNAEGRTQALALAERLAGVPLAAVYSSPLERAFETAEPLAAQHGLEIQVREALGETGFGDWVGRELEELRKEALWPVIQVYPGGARFPGGESMREVQARVVAELDTIRDRHQGQTVAAVLHADPIKLAVAYYLGLSLDLFQRIAISPASVTAFHFTRLGPHLVVLNSTPGLPDFEIQEAKEETGQLESEEQQDAV